MNLKAWSSTGCFLGVDQVKVDLVAIEGLHVEDRVGLGVGVAAVAGLEQEGIGVGAAKEPVAALAAIDDVDAAEALERIGTAFAGKRLAPVGAGARIGA